MSNKQLITALGICLSLSSMIAAAETTTAIQPNVENTATFDTAATSAQKSELTADEINTYNNLAIQENRPTLIGRSLNKIGEIGNQSIEQIGVLGSKIAVNASGIIQANYRNSPFCQRLKGSGIIIIGKVGISVRQYFWVCNGCSSSRIKLID